MEKYKSELLSTHFHSQTNVKKTDNILTYSEGQKMLVNIMPYNRTMPFFPATLRGKQR